MTKTEKVCKLAREAADKCAEAAREFRKDDHPVEHYDFTWMSSVLNRAADRLERTARERASKRAQVADVLATELV